MADFSPVFRLGRFFGKLVEQELAQMLRFYSSSRGTPMREGSDLGHQTQGRSGGAVLVATSSIHPRRS